jgi:hypothetical protein
MELLGRVARWPKRRMLSVLKPGRSGERDDDRDAGDRRCGAVVVAVAA